MRLPQQLAGRKRVHLIGRPEEDEGEEITMPRRKAEAVKPAETEQPRQKRKYTRRKAAPAKVRVASRREVAAPSFAVWDDGSVQIESQHCKGKLSPEEASQLVAFVARLRGEA